MKIYYCSCGQPVFFENTQCNGCGRVLGFDTEQMTVLSFNWGERGNLVATSGEKFKYCNNFYDFSICNWVLPADSNDCYCKACALNEMIPQVTAPEKRYWWYNLEQAKRRLVYTLLKLKLPLKNRHQHADGLAFAFLEDRRMNPEVEQELVKTGHAQGLITVYLAEADDVARESTRVAMGESYRTLLGHFRHESGHYYFDQLIKNRPLHEDFKKIFGDDSADYQQALQNYYANPPLPAAQSGFISDYAQSHPLEDWAECWAHYLHMMDTLETAATYGLAKYDPFTQAIDDWLAEWPRVTLILNELNRSMGLRDAYPFVLSEQSIRKLHFVHRVIDPRLSTS